jgi:hypothetical protein
MQAFEALNFIENGGSVLVSLPGCISSVFRVTSSGVESFNIEIGHCTGKTLGETFKHFQSILSMGGELTQIEN